MFWAPPHEGCPTTRAERRRLWETAASWADRGTGVLGSSTMPRAVMGKYAVVRFNQWPEGVQFGWMCGIVPVGDTGSPIGVAAAPEMRIACSARGRCSTRRSACSVLAMWLWQVESTHLQWLLAGWTGRPRGLLARWLFGMWLIRGRTAHSGLQGFSAELLRVSNSGSKS